MNAPKFLTRINASREDDERTIAECVRLRRTYLLELRESGAFLFRRRNHCLVGHRSRDGGDELSVELDAQFVQLAAADRRGLRSEEISAGPSWGPVE